MIETIDFTAPLQWILPKPGGRFETIGEFAPGAELAHVEPIEHEDGQIIDSAAWTDAAPDRWLLWTGSGVVLGSYELALSGFAEVPIRLVETPADWVVAHARGRHWVACVLRWDGPLAETLSPAWQIVPEKPALASRLERALRNQWARPCWLGRPREHDRAA